MTPKMYCCRRLGFQALQAHIIWVNSHKDIQHLGNKGITCVHILSLQILKNTKSKIVEEDCFLEEKYIL